MTEPDPEAGSLLLETLIAIAILSAAVLAAGMAVANAVSVSDRAARTTASISELRLDLRRAGEEARACAEPEASAPCVVAESGWTAAPSEARALAAHPVLADRTCQFDFVSRQCRAE